MTDVDNFLAHFGVKGMRWGQRKAQKVRATASDDAKAAGDAFTKLKKKGIHTLSNKELQTVVNRMNLEQQYSRLNESRKSSGAKIAKELLSVGRTAYEAYSFMNKTGALSTLSKLMGR